MIVVFPDRGHVFAITFADMDKKKFCTTGRQSN